MISTVDANNGFRRELLPLAMSRSSIATDGLYNAILALAAFHRHGSGAALPYKTYALRLLSHSLEKETASDGETESQLAASMMLCVYNVSPILPHHLPSSDDADTPQVFDESEGNWNLHLNGSRTLLHQHADAKGGNLDYNFLNTWFLYHEILGAFSQPHKHQYQGLSSLDLMKGNAFDKCVVGPTPSLEPHVLHGS